MPLCVDLYAGLGGWSEGFLAESYDVIGFDIERHDYGTGGYPGQLVLQDVLTLHGSQFSNAACIVASPPCQEFSYMAMPWSRAKQIRAALRCDADASGLVVDFPEGYTGSRSIPKLTELFDACFRIQREASEAAGEYIPLVVENVKGAQPWVGKAQANYGSFYLWGDVRSVGGRIIAANRVEFGAATVQAKRQGKNGHIGGGSWFAIGSPGQTNVGQNPDGRKVPNMNFHDYDKTGQPGRSFQSAAVESTGLKFAGNGTSAIWSEREHKRDWGLHPEDGVWKDADGNVRGKDRTSARKAASAQIAKIPFELSRHIARCFKPEPKEQIA